MAETIDILRRVYDTLGEKKIAAELKEVQLMIAAPKPASSPDRKGRPKGK